MLLCVFLFLFPLPVCDVRVNTYIFTRVYVCVVQLQDNQVVDVRSMGEDGVNAVVVGAVNRTNIKRVSLNTLVHLHG